MKILEFSVLDNATLTLVGMRALSSCQDQELDYYLLSRLILPRCRRHIRVRIRSPLAQAPVPAGSARKPDSRMYLCADDLRWGIFV